MADKSPTQLKAVEPTYQFVLKFNERAELVDVGIPEGMAMELALNHVAVATLWMAQQLAEKARETDGQAAH